MREVKFLNQLLQFLRLVFLTEIGQLEHRADVIFDAHLAEYTRFLRQITDTHLRASVHRESSDILVVKENTAVVGCHQTCRHIECGRLAGSVRTQQTNNLALFQLDGHIVHYGSFAVFLY